MATSASLDQPLAHVSKPQPVPLDAGPAATHGEDRMPRRIGRVRRAADVIVALAGLAVTLPVLALAALAVRLDGPGPVLHRHPHVGASGGVFHLLTLRSAETSRPGREVQATRVGRILRPARIDQLPVLFNLLRGDLTLVGPAPHATARAGASRGLAAGPPGVTGWVAQD